MDSQKDQLQTQRPSGAESDEKIDVAQVRIFQPSLQMSAVLGEIRLADRLLNAWADCCNDYFFCEFEVTFVDGLIFRGEYEAWRKSRRWPSLATYIKTHLVSLLAGRQGGFKQMDSRDQDPRFANLELPDIFLQQYAIDPL
ncbi:hypothetical protein [Undibacterium sp.]|uniref:hypothetical protein n=1 Tax=Undibacterium sp. TaxID=1914977 RepID=UPI00374CBA55